MDFYYDVVDWVGGYPYQYASVAEIVQMLQELGFASVKVVPTEVPTGCNEFVFQRKGSATRGTEFLCP
jgi:2-polyprenyl-6-hydroxyphenyl methylase/3-demethylubiquinone-9 3-methyltransferase